jgi:UDP-N-acetylmuramate dehydrogenase
MMRENVSLKELTTFRIGGSARFFAAAATLAEVGEAAAFARERSLPLFVLGGGSNILVGDEGFPGVVLKIEIKGIEIGDADANGKRLVTAGAGEVWDDLVKRTVEERLSGLENLSLIPGTVGAAPVQNIGAYGIEVKDTITWVEVFDPRNGEITRMTAAECSFGYRSSFFKTPAGKGLIVIRAAFLLEPNGAPDTSYKDIGERISSNAITDVDAQKVRDIVISIRRAKLPDVGKLGTAGSFFKNPIIPLALYDGLKKRFPAMPGYPGAEGGVKIPAAWILDNVCGFKGYRQGETGVYENQALVLVNFGNAAAEEIKSLAEKMTACVKKETDISLEREVEYI